MCRCSCARDGVARASVPLRELRARARSNAATYTLLGTVERFDASLRLLSRKLSLSQLVPSASRAWRRRRPSVSERSAEGGRENTLEACVRRDALPDADRPTAAQRLEVQSLLAQDVAFYYELDRQLSTQLAAWNVTGPQ